MLTFAAMRALRPASTLLAPFLVLGAAPACGGSAFDGHVFRTDEITFRVGPIPAEWQRIDAGEAVLAFRDEKTPASIAVTGRCGKDGDDVPLESLTHHLFLEFTERRVESQTRINLDGREALHTDLLAKLDGVEKRFTIFVLKKNGCVYDFMHIAPPDASADGRQRFVTFVEGFSTVSP